MILLRVILWRRERRFAFISWNRNHVYICAKLHHPIVNNHTENKNNNLAARASVTGKIHIRVTLFTKMHRFIFSTRRRIAIESKTTHNSYRTVVKKANLYESFPWPPFPRFSFLLRINLTNEWNICKIISIMWCQMHAALLRSANAFSPSFVQYRTHFLNTFQRKLGDLSYQIAD